MRNILQKAAIGEERAERAERAKKAERAERAVRAVAITNNVVPRIEGWNVRQAQHGIHAPIAALNTSPLSAIFLERSEDQNLFRL